MWRILQLIKAKEQNNKARMILYLFFRKRVIISIFYDLCCGFSIYLLPKASKCQ